jgi:hypothetical protein
VEQTLEQLTLRVKKRKFIKSIQFVDFWY